LGDVFYGYNQFQKTISSIDLQTDEVETLVTLPDDESDYVSSIIDFDGSLYVNITSAGVFAYDLNSDFTNRAGIPVRDSTDTIDIEVTPSRFFISGSDLYRSGGGSGGGAIYKLTDGKFIARNYTEQGYLNPLAFDDDIVCGITNIYTLYCGTMN